MSEQAYNLNPDDDLQGHNSEIVNEKFSDIIPESEIQDHAGDGKIVAPSTGKSVAEGAKSEKPADND
jgi:hypothetical protein